MNDLTAPTILSGNVSHCIFNTTVMNIRVKIYLKLAVTGLPVQGLLTSAFFFGSMRFFFFVHWAFLLYLLYGVFILYLYLTLD